MGICGKDWVGTSVSWSGGDDVEHVHFIAWDTKKDRVKILHVDIEHQDAEHPQFHIHGIDEMDVP